MKMMLKNAQFKFQSWREFQCLTSKGIPEQVVQQYHLLLADTRDKPRPDHINKIQA